MFFLFVLIALFEPSANSLLSLGQEDPSVLVVVMAFFIAWGVCWLPIVAVLAITLNWQPQKILQPEQKLPTLVSLYLLAPLIVWGVGWLTNTSLLDYGLVNNISMLGSLGLGFGLGVLSLAVMFLFQLAIGWCSFQDSNTVESLTHASPLQTIILPILLIALFVGGIEELVFRGFLFTELNYDYSVWVAAVVSSIVFAILHLMWERQETIPQLPGLWLMGMILVLAQLVDRGSLGLAWGLHAGWVWAIACLDTAQLIHYTGKVPEWVTGKNKKPLAGAAGIVCLLLTGVVLWLFYAYV